MGWTGSAVTFIQRYRMDWTLWVGVDSRVLYGDDNVRSLCGAGSLVQFLADDVVPLLYNILKSVAASIKGAQRGSSKGLKSVAALTKGLLSPLLLPL